MHPHDPIPRFGLGTWKRRGDEAYRCVSQALEMGYRHVDTAEAYENEVEVGRAIAASGLPREAVFVTTKVKPEHFGPGRVMGHVRASLDRLGMARADLILAHWPAIGDAYNIEDYLAQFAAVREAGLCDRLGVSNFTRSHLDAAVRILGRDSVATNQVECHVLLQNGPIVDHTQGYGIPVTAYCPLAQGHLAEVAGLRPIASAHGATPEQVGLAFLLAEGHIVIPSSGNQARLRQNWDAQALRLTRVEMAAIRKLDEGRRLVNGAWCPVWDM